VQPSFDLSSGIITVKVRAFTPQDAALVAQAVLGRAQALVDEMSNAARQNALAYATQTATDAQAKLAGDETSLTAYRNRYAVLFPALSAQQNSTVGGELLLALAQDQASLAALRAQGQGGASPQVQTLETRIAAEQAQEKALAAQLAAANGGKALPLATVVSGYDTLTETQALDQQLYASDLLALQNARNVAAEKSLYLESFVQPAAPDSSIYPIRWLVIVETALAGFITWILVMLVSNVVRDQLD
jgi:capsular polysaccharide transport system permease protein